MYWRGWKHCTVCRLYPGNCAASEDTDGYDCPPQQMIHTLKPGWLPLKLDLVSCEPFPSWQKGPALALLHGLRDSLPDFQYPWPTLHTSDLTWGQGTLKECLEESRSASSLPSLTKMASTAGRTVPSLCMVSCTPHTHLLPGNFVFLKYSSFFFYSFGEQSW